jgi:hypothetical protein
MTALIAPFPPVTSAFVFHRVYQALPNCAVMSLSIPLSSPTALHMSGRRRMFSKRQGKRLVCSDKPHLYLQLVDTYQPATIIILVVVVNLIGAN